MKAEKLIKGDKYIWNDMIVTYIGMMDYSYEIKTTDMRHTVFSKKTQLQHIADPKDIFEYNLIK